MKAGFAHMNVLTVVQASQVCFERRLSALSVLLLFLYLVRISVLDCEVF